MKLIKEYDPENHSMVDNIASDLQGDYNTRATKSNDWLVRYIDDLGVSEYLEMNSSAVFALSPILNNNMAVSNAIGRGLPLDSLQDFKLKSGLDSETIAGILEITSRSIRRYKQGDNTRLRPDTSERLFGLIEIFELGVEVFGDMNKFKRWLNQESVAMGDATPMSLLKDGYGRQLVKSALVRIDHGIFA